MKAFGHPARIAILDYLTKVNQAICNDIVNELPLSQPTIVQHLQELKKSGLIRGVFKASRIYYSINMLTFSRIDEYYRDMIKKMDKGEGTKRN